MKFINLFRSSNSSLIRETRWVFAGNIITIVCSSVFTFYSAKLLGVEAYGIVALIMASIGIIQELLSFRTWEAVLNFGYKKLDENKNLFMSSFLSLVIFDLLMFTIVLVLVLLGGQLIQIYFIKEVGHFKELIIYTFALFFSFNKGTFSAFIRIFKRFDINSIISASNSFLKLIFGILLLSISPSILSFFTVSLLTNATSCFLYFYFFKKLSKQNDIPILVNMPTVSVFFSLLKEVRSFITTTYWVSTLKSITTRVTPIVIATFLNVEVVGMYKLARDITSIFTLAITDTIYNIAYPKISKLINKNVQEMKRIIIFLTLFGVASVALYGLGVFLFGEMVLNVLFKEYTSIITILKLVILELFVLIYPSWMIPLIMSAGKEKHNLLSRVINSGTLMILLILLTPAYKLIGVQISLIISSTIYVIYLTITSFFIFRNLEFKNRLDIDKTITN